MSTTTINYSTVSRQVREALMATFGPNAAIRTDEGEYGHVFVKIVSDRFDGMSEGEKQSIIWDTLRDSLGSDSQSVALVLAFGTDQI